MPKEEMPSWPGEEEATEPLPPGGEGSGIQALTVTWGEETHNPIQYHTVKVGGLTATVVPAQGESVQEAARRAWKVLDEIAREQFNEKLDGFFGRAREAAQRAKGYR